MIYTIIKTLLQCVHILIFFFYPNATVIKSENASFTHIDVHYGKDGALLLQMIVHIHGSVLHQKH